MDLYEKKYNEALERARDVYTYYCDDREQLRKIESIFPELKESEDEKSKKWILEYLYDGLQKSDEQFKGQFKAAIAWLEKQGKRDARYKYLEELLEADTEYQIAMNDAMVEEAKTKAMEAISDMPIFELLGLEKQGEQKTEPCIGCTNNKGCVTCEHGELRETHTRTLNADKVIEWMKPYSAIVDNIIDDFKKDFGI